MNPFTSISMAGTGGAIVVILNAIFPLFGIEVPEGSVEAALEGFLNVVGFILLIVGQVRRKDLSIGLIRK